MKEEGRNKKASFFKSGKKHLEKNISRPDPVCSGRPKIIERKLTTQSNLPNARTPH